MDLSKNWGPTPSSLPAKEQPLALLTSVSMATVKQWSSPNVSNRFMKCADVLLVLDDGVAIPCHSQILSLHSAVMSKMFEDLASQPNQTVKIPLADFTEAQCVALLAYLYSHGVCSKGAAFDSHDAAAHDAAVAVARFAHTYDAPHALHHVHVYLSAFMDARFTGKDCAGLTGETCDKVVLAWAVMADKLDMHDLCGHCERAMVMYWESFQDKPALLEQLSSGALQRIAKELNKSLTAPAVHQWSSAASGFDAYLTVTNRPAEGMIKCSKQGYPGVREFIAWRRQKQPPVHQSGTTRPASTAASA